MRIRKSDLQFPRCFCWTINEGECSRQSHSQAWLLVSQQSAESFRCSSVNKARNHGAVLDHVLHPGWLVHVLPGHRSWERAKSEQMEIDAD